MPPGQGVGKQLVGGVEVVGRFFEFAGDEALLAFVNSTEADGLSLADCLPTNVES